MVLSILWSKSLHIYSSLQQIVLVKVTTHPIDYTVKKESVLFIETS